MIRAEYDNERFVNDSTREEIEQQTSIPAVGLYFMYHGDRVTPKRVYFGCHFYRDDNKLQHYGGSAWCHYDNALRAVYMENGEQFRVPQLRDVCASYNGSVLYNFYKE